MRSMMGDFGGNAGLLSLWFDKEAWEWKYEYATCPLGNQVYWWFTHIWDVCVIIWTVLYFTLSELEKRGVDVDAGAKKVWDFMLRRKRRDVKRGITPS